MKTLITLVAEKMVREIIDTNTIAVCGYDISKFDSNGLEKLVLDAIKYCEGADFEDWEDAVYLYITDSIKCFEKNIDNASSFDDIDYAFSMESWNY